MKKIEVLGPGCANCVRLEKVAREAVEMAGVEAEVVKVTDYASDRRLRRHEHARPRHRRQGRELRPNPLGRRHRPLAERVAGA